MLYTNIIYHVLYNPGAYANLLPILHNPFCALENGDTSECYTGQIVRLPIKMIHNFPNTKGFTSDNDIIPIDAFIKRKIFYAFQKRRLRTKIYKFTNSDAISYFAKDYKRGLNSS